MFKCLLFKYEDIIWKYILRLRPVQSQEEDHDGGVDEDDDFDGQVLPYPAAHHVAEMQNEYEGDLQQKTNDVFLICLKQLTF